MSNSNRRADGWENLITGLSNNLRDKTLGMTPYVEIFTPEQNELIYNSSDMAQRIIDTLPNEMTRAGFDVKVEGDEDVTEKIEARIDELEVMKHFNKALKLARIQGGAAVFIGVNDGETNLAVPLNLAKVKSIDFFTVFDSRELRVFEWQNNPFDKDFGLPSIYQLNPRALQLAIPPEQMYIHASRLIRFEGSEYFRGMAKAQREWPHSVLSRVYGVIRQFESAWGSATALMEDFAQAVFSITGLADAISADKEDLIRKRYEAIDYFRSSRRAIVIDAEKEKFERTNSQIGGLSDVLEQFALRLSAAANMPAALLMGQSPSGLNSTGASELRWFYDQVSASQNFMMKPALNLIVKMLFLEIGEEPENWCIQFRALWQPTDKEIADVRQQVAQADSQYVAMGALSPDEVAKSRFGGDGYSIDTYVDMRDSDEIMGTEEDANELNLRPDINTEYHMQIMALVTQVAAGQISRESAIASMNLFFKISPEQAAALLGPENFEAKVAPKAGATGKPSEDKKPMNAAQEDRVATKTQG